MLLHSKAKENEGTEGGCLVHVRKGKNGRGVEGKGCETKGEELEVYHLMWTWKIGRKNINQEELE